MKRYALLIVIASLAGSAPAQRTPLALTGFNYDGIADGTSASSSTTGTLDSIYDYFTMGFDAAVPSAGLPTAIFTSAADATTTFQFAPAKGNNLLWLQQHGSGATSGTLTLVTPEEFSSLAFLETGFNGSQPTGYSLNFSTGSPTTGSFTASDNFNNTGFAIDGFGRVSRSDGVFDSVGTTNPRIYQITVTLSSADEARTLDSITFTNNETSGTAFHDVGIFGVSGAVVAAPEPVTMLALGVGVLALARKRRRN
jgi:hypothetical protein